jgi:hypothetical protein
LDLVLELDEGDVVTARNQTNLFEAGKLKVEEKQKKSYYRAISKFQM